jgi:catechol 2,3-dioxygenase-like lactoylglutathione lyase family enzyme
MAGVKRIGQIAVSVSNLERAVAFYRDVLGLKFLFQAPPGLAFFMCGDVRLMLALPEKDQPVKMSSVIYYLVDDIQAEFKALLDKGAKAEGEPHLIARMPDHELWMAFFRDPDDNMFALMSEVRNG